MRYTDEPPIDRIYPGDTLQIFSAMIAGIGGGFQWPLCVFGLIAIRDHVDHNRNIIFQRSRSECQTLTKEVCSNSFHSLFWFVWCKAALLPNASFTNFQQLLAHVYHYYVETMRLVNYYGI